MEELNSTLSRHFFKCVSLTEKQSWGRLVVSLIFTIVALNWTILGEVYGCNKLISGFSSLPNSQ